MWSERYGIGTVLFKEDDIELWIETSWIEDDQTEFNRVVIMEFFCQDMIFSDSDSLSKTVGPTLRSRIDRKLEQEIGLKHEQDYIYANYDNPVMRDGKWIAAPMNGEHRIEIRFKEEEHFAMLKLHYHGN